MKEEDYQKLLDRMDTTEVAIPEPKVLQEHEKDYEFTRKKLKGLISNGEAVLEHFVEVALETTEPKMVEALAKLLDTLGSLSKGVMDNAATKSNVDDKLAKQESSKEIGSGKGEGNKIIFIGDMHSLISKVQEEQKKELEVIENDPKL